ncbi:hypothetical protein OV090_01855 [Nannocystis sp. RBIL2]|uniref:hypothetical protein n=1 Tax=Nannocystis sp. RBIL2 TaxID=2996788 RepID=UPI0022709F12|nr:hypothetical protein [Nannocystis sp. RBIL2]MCY1063486.1 hypothetical protein [Nannocystis sp. RBIL2]
MSNQGDWSWSEEALYACPCGSLVAARRWRWLDRQARPELVATLRASGPLVGACSRCRRPATGGGAWLEVDPDRGAATLVLSADRRGDLIPALQAHLAALQARPELAAPWLLQPAVAFVPVPPPWAEEADEAALELSPWPGPALGSRAQDSGVRASEPARGHDESAPGSAARAEEAGSKGHVPAARAEEAGSKGHVPGGKSAGDGGRGESSGPSDAARTRRREGSGPVAASDGRRRESSGPSDGVTARRREGSGPVEAVLGRGREGSGPSDADAKGPPRSGRDASLAESVLQDTFPGRRRGRSAEDIGLEESGSLVSAARRSFEASGQAAGKREEPAGRRLEGTGSNGQDAAGAGRRADSAGDAVRRPAAVLEGTGSNGQDASGMSGGAGRRADGVGDAVRRPAAVLEGTGSNGQDASGMSGGAGRRADGVGDAVRRPAAVLEGTGSNGQDASGMSGGAGRRADGAGDAVRRPAAVLEGAGGADESGRRPTVGLEATDGPATRRPAAVLEGTDGPATRRPAAVPEGVDGPSTRRPAAVLEATDGPSTRRPGAVLEGTDGPSTRRPGAVLEGTGLNRQDPGAMSAGTGRRDEPNRTADADPERSALRAAVARALTPSAPETPRPAAVLPGPTAEASAADSSGTWSRRQVEAADAAARRSLEGADSRQVSDAAVTGTWPKRQILEGPGDSGPGWPRLQEEPPRSNRPGRAPAAPPVRLGSDVQRAALASLGRDGGAVQVTANVNEATARVWATVPLKVRPIHLRGLGYPLVGVRVVADAGGEALVIDAVVDVGEPMTLDLFKQLTREFKIRLALPGHQRELLAPELQRNAASCLESAQAQLGTGEFPPDAYRTARELLAGRNAAQRLEPARTPLPESLAETCRDSAGAAWLALERLDQGSRKENLARLLEVDGLSVDTYEKIRSAVLAAAIEFGLPAPARFWRRWLGSDQARDTGPFVQKLIAARTASIARGEDLSAEQAEAAWRGILDLCHHKDLTPPPELSKALGLGKVTTGRRASQPQIKAAAEVTSPVQEARSQARLRELAARLRGAPSDGDVRAVIGNLPELSEADVASLLPALAELGSRVGPELLACVRAPQRHVRQAAAILLGHLGERKAEGPLVAMLGDEPSAGWVDAARALGNLGPRVVGPLCSLLRSAPTSRKEVVGARVARALAELIKADGAGPGGSGRVAVENLLEVGDPSVSSAARRALATLGAVRDEVDGDEAEASRRFSRLASDAIAPEIDAAEDDEIDEVEVEVGD